MTNQALQLLVVGRKQSAEFQPVVRFLESLGSKNSKSSFIENIVVDSGTNGPQNLQPDLVVVLQSHPDEFDENDFEILISRYPMALLVCCYGSWCESFQRTREAWPLACCVPARNASERIENDIRAILGEQKPLPLMASRSESFDYYVG